MNSLEQLNGYLRRLEGRFQLAVIIRGAAVATAVALISTVVVVLLTNFFAFSARSVVGGRFLLFLSLAFAFGFGLIIPVLKLNRRKAARAAERKFPEFEQRLLTFVEKEAEHKDDPFFELLAANTVDTAEQAEPRRVVESRRVFGFFSVVVASSAALLWLTFSGPGFLGYGTALLWAGTPHVRAQPFYDIVVSPGSRTVRRGTSQAVTASLVGFQSDRVRLFARYRSTSKWEEAQMLPQEGRSAYEFLFATIPETVDYYVVAGRLRSKTYSLSVVDLPVVKRIRVTYRFPTWTGLKETVEDPGGDLRAVEGTEAEVAVETDRPLRQGLLVLNDGSEVSLNAGKGNWRSARLKIQRDGLYHVAVREQSELIRLSHDYFIEAQDDTEPSVRIVRPGRDARVSPIEEVLVAVEADDDFELRQMNLHYAVNGTAEKTVPLLTQKGCKRAESSTIIYLEDFKLVPGDVVALHATARDARATAKTDIYFLEAQPFERQYIQSQQMGSGGGGGGDGSRISQRQKEIIAATWNQLRDTSQGRAVGAENAKFLAEVQGALRDQARSLARRMRRRRLSRTNQEFRNFSGDMEKAAKAMDEAVGQLGSMRWREALAPEQKALQHLLRAEATFRQIQVAFGNRGGGGGGGRDLESLFDLELDTEKNQYETGQQVASANHRSREIDEALQRLEQLARRQQELAERRRHAQLSPQQRWQQEMLRREAEQLQRRMEQLMRGGSQSSTQGQHGGQSAGATGGRSQRLSSMGRQSQVDPRLEQALRRLEEATRDMRRAASAERASEQTGSKRAAERLQEARDLMRGLRRQEASEQLDDIVRQGERLAAQQQDFANRVRRVFREQLKAGEGSPSGQTGTPQSRRRGPSREQIEQSRHLAEERGQMTGALTGLERDMQRAARDLSDSQRTVSAKLRRALGSIQQEELALRMKYNTELLRRGLGQYVWLREAPITKGLHDLRDQLRQARAALERNPAGQEGAERALAQLERLRSQMERLAEGAGGQERGPSGKQQNPGGVGPVRDFSAMNLGDRLPPPGGAEPRSGNAADLQRLYRESLRDLSLLRHSMRESPEAAREIQALIHVMQGLDASRFPGNPELLARLRTRVLPTLEQIEVQLRRELDEQQEGQVRTGASEPVPVGYADAVAEYFRRLSKKR